MKLFELVEPGFELVRTLENQLSRHDPITALANAALEHEVDPKEVFEAAVRFQKYRLDEIMRAKPTTINGYTVRGQDDWLVFVTDQEGNWYYVSTEMDPAWTDISGPAHVFSAKDTLKVGLNMLRRGARPERVTEPSAVADLKKHFG